MGKTTYTATAPDGRVVTRTSNKTYVAASATYYAIDDSYGVSFHTTDRIPAGAIRLELEKS